MVKRRFRKQSSSDCNDSDSDCSFYNEKEDEQPTKKKYSLRERKGPSPRLVFNFDDDDEDDDDEEGKVSYPTDDEDFEIEPELNDDIQLSDNLPNFPTTNGTEPEGGGLIDFEDIIRADIVINRHKVDYDNIIEKTEIKMQKRKARKGGQSTKELFETKLEEGKEEIKLTDENEELNDCKKNVVKIKMEKESIEINNE